MEFNTNFKWKPQQLYPYTHHHPQSKSAAVSITFRYYLPSCLFPVALTFAQPKQTTTGPRRNQPSHTVTAVADKLNRRNTPFNAAAATDKLNAPTPPVPRRWTLRAGLFGADRVGAGGVQRNVRVPHLHQGAHPPAAGADPGEPAAVPGRHGGALYKLNTVCVWNTKH
jgi:hypothetical protein